ncbi:MAG: hypothetical protein WBA46_13770 [Thermomicrobiales bacterium]
MPTLTASDIILILGMLGAAVKWWSDRRDARSALAKAKTDAEKTVTSLTETIDAKNEELEEQGQVIAFWQGRAQHLEGIVYRRESP